MNKKYLIGNAHIDPVWQWKYDEGLSLIKSTFLSAINRMEEFPSYVFTSACASYYEWIKESEPEMFETIKKLVKEGRWGLSGNMWVQPDCNIPTGESFCRHMLYSERFFLENFSFFPKSGYNVDSFGHNASLPQIFRKSGVENYVYLRPSSETENLHMTKERLHIWEGNDGSKVLCSHIPDAYTGLVNIDRLKLIESDKYPGLFFYGVGNHGGGPTIAMLKEVERLREENPGYYLYSTVDNYFSNARKETNLSSLDVQKGDLQHHASGCYSANSKIKALNAKAEKDIIQAEKMDVLSSILTGTKTHEKEIKEAWKSIMFNQFHDILAGCAIYPAYQDAYEGFGYSSHIASKITTFANEKISFAIDTSKYFSTGESEMKDRMWVKKGEGSPLVIFNPLSFPIKRLIKIDCTVLSKIIDEDGVNYPLQKTRADYTDGPFYNDYLFECEIPAYGYKTFFLFGEEESPIEEENEFRFGENWIENSKIKVVFSKEDGSISSLFDKEKKVEFVRSGFAKGVLIDDIDNDTWAHNVFIFDKKVGEFASPSFEIIEKGPLRACFKVSTHLNSSTITQYFYLRKGEKEIEVRCNIDFHEKHKITKLCFPLSFPAKIRYSSSYGYIEKEATGEEEIMHRYIDLYGKDGMGLGIINENKYSGSFCDNEFRMIIARSAAYLDHFGKEHRDESMRYMDQGENEFLYSIIPHGSFEEVIKEAYMLSYPPLFYKETHHKGCLPTTYNGLEVSENNIIIEAIKKQEDGLGYILRMVETTGKKTKCHFDLSFLGVSFDMEFGPLEFKTIFISNDKKTIKEVETNEVIDR